MTSAYERTRSRWVTTDPVRADIARHHVHVWIRYFEWRLRQPVWLLAPVTGLLFGVTMGVFMGLVEGSIRAGLFGGAVAGVLMAVLYPLMAWMARRHPTPTR